MSDQDLKPIIPGQGLAIPEEKPFYVLCKPKLLPLKSLTLEKLEKMQSEALAKAKKQMNEDLKGSSDLV